MDGETMTPYLELTEWAQRFKREAPFQYAEALEYAKRDTLSVRLELRHDMEQPLWAVVVDDDADFWMDAFDYQEDAMNLCMDMGWHINHDQPPR